MGEARAVLQRTRIRWSAGAALGGLTIGVLALGTGTSAASFADGVRDRAGVEGPASASAPAARQKRAGTTARVKNDRQLRTAVRKANARPGKDTIVLVSDVNLKVHEGRADSPRAGDLDVRGQLVVRGRDHTIDARGRDRVFDVAPGARLVLRAVTLRNGAPAAGEGGGAVRSRGTVLATDVVVTRSRTTGPDSPGGAFLNDGGVLDVSGGRIVANTASGDGGGLWNSAQGAMTLRGVAIDDNSSTTAGSAGGGIYNDGGSLTLRSVALRANGVAGVNSRGGAIATVGGDVLVVDGDLVANRAAAGGGLFASDQSAVRIESSELVRNAATSDAGSARSGGGGVLVTNAELTVIESELAGNRSATDGGGLAASAAQVELRASELRGNTAGVQGGALSVLGGETAILDGTVLDGNGARVGGGLASYGGGDVVVTDAVVRGNTATDDGGGVYAQLGTLTVTTSRILDNQAYRGGGILLGNGRQAVVQDSTISGNAAVLGGGIHSDLNDFGGVLDGPLVTGCTIEDNYAERQGGGIDLNYGRVVDSSVTGNSTAAGGRGGGLYARYDVAVERTTFVDNASGRGGAVSVAFGALSITGSRLEANAAIGSNGAGGAVHAEDSRSVTVVDSDIVDNTAAAEGGGFWSSGSSSMRVDASLISGNSAAGDHASGGGGGFFQDGGEGGNLTVTASTISDNTATGARGGGGGILNDQAEVVVRDSVLSGNTAVRAGGGIEANFGTTALTDVDLDANVAGPDPGFGGGLHAGGNAVITWDGGTVSNNAASGEGGGLWCSAGASVTADGLVFGANSSARGSDVFHQIGATGGSCTVNGSSITSGTGAP